MKKNALTEQIIAALAEGAPPSIAEAPIQPLGLDETKIEVKVEPAKAEATSTETVVEAKAETPEAKAPANSELVNHLQGQLSAAQSQLLAVSVELNTAKTKATDTENVLASMRGITASSVERMRVALNYARGDTSTMSNEALLSEHASLRAQFEKQYTAGGVAAVSSTGSNPKTESAEDLQRRARINANRTAK